LLSGSLNCSWAATPFCCLGFGGGKSCREPFPVYILWTPLDFRFRHISVVWIESSCSREITAKSLLSRVISTHRLLVSEFFGIIRNIDHTASEAKRMKNGLLTIGTILALTGVGQAKDKSASAQNSEQTRSMPNLGAIIVYRQWSFSGAGRPNWRFKIDNGPDLIIRNGTYLRLDVAPGDHVLDHKHMLLLSSDPQTVYVKAGETVYFQYVDAASLIFEVADDQARAARTVSKMRTVEEALAQSRH
jgi:hypothetical protein